MSAWPTPSPGDPADVEGRAEFDAEVAEHDRRERRLVWKELAVIVFVTVVVVVRQLWLD
jgi:hypothetical protein